MARGSCNSSVLGSLARQLHPTVDSRALPNGPRTILRPRPAATALHRRHPSSRSLATTVPALARRTNEVRPLGGGGALGDDGEGVVSRGGSAPPSTTTPSALHAAAVAAADADAAATRKPSALRTALASTLRAVTPGTVQKYAVHRATQALYRACAGAGQYRMPEAARRAGRTKSTEAGEEVGVSAAGDGVWHREFNLLPTFSTWAQVTMLHLYLVTARLRCLPDREASQSWQHQLADHFFQDAEEAMDVRHGLRSGMLRQRYLKELFLQWRGLTAAYDEGLVKGDAWLAAAVWRNLFKARGAVVEEGKNRKEVEEDEEEEDEDLVRNPTAVEVRNLAAIVAWMRATLRDLEQVADEDLGDIERTVFTRDVRDLFAVVDVQSTGAREAVKGVKADKQKATSA